MKVPHLFECINTSVLLSIIYLYVSNTNSTEGWYRSIQNTQADSIVIGTIFTKIEAPKGLLP